MKRTMVVLFVICAFALPGFAAVSAAVETVAPEVVTGSRIYTSLDELPAPTYVITAEDIEQSGADNLATVLEQNVPGVFVKQKSGVAQDAQITMRGVVTQVLVLVDGVPLYRSSHVANAATVDYRAFPLENIERVEVVKGGGSAVYGSMAAGGVINIITKKPDGTEAVTLAETGPNGWRRYYASGSAAGETIAARIWYEHIDEGRKRLCYVNTPATREDSLGYDSDAYGVNLSGDDWVFRVTRGDYSYGWENSGHDDHDAKTYSRYSFRYNADDWYALLGYDTQCYKSYTAWGNNIYEDSAYTLEIGGNGTSGEAIYAWGVFSRFEETDFGTIGGSLTSQDRTNIAPFTEWSFAWGDWLANIGLRYEIWDQEGNDYDELIPRISFQRQFANGNMFYASASRVFAMPSFYELYVDDGWTTGNPNLNPEKGWSYEVGLNNRNSRNSWQICLFYLKLMDKIKYDSGTYINVAEFHSYGIEASKRWNLGQNWTLGLNGTWQKPEEKATSSSSWTRGQGMPEWELGGSLEYKTGPWSALLSANWVGNRMGDAANNWNPDDYVMVDLTISWKQDNDTVRLYCTNLFDEDYTFESGGWYYYGPERGFRLSWEHRF